MRQYSTIEIYLQTLVNCEQNDWARLLPIAEYAYNNATIVSTSQIPFELNSKYHPCVSFKNNVNYCSRSRLTEELRKELRDLISVF